MPKAKYKRNSGKKLMSGGDGKTRPKDKKSTTSKKKKKES